jgi:hypothetical protein
MSLSSSINKQEDMNSSNDSIDFTSLLSSNTMVNRPDSMTSSHNNYSSTTTTATSSSSLRDDNLDKLKILINGTLSDDDNEDDDYYNNDLLLKDKSLCSSSELEVIRRERNRMHAKKTRLRKKKMLSEMEAVSK